MSRILCRFEELYPARLRARAWNLLRRVRRAAAGWKHCCVTLHPEGAARSHVLFAGQIEPFLQKDGSPISYDHTNYWESVRMARTFQELGYIVDVIHWSNDHFIPLQPYDVYVDVRRNFARLAMQLPPKCLKILHIDTAHHSFHNAAQRRRLAELEARRGLVLPPCKLVEENQAIEWADCASVLGNDFTMDTYRHAGKPLYRIPISAPFQYPFADHKDFASARRWFLWFGGDGFVHKGLDLALDAFSALPDLHLVVCGPLENELPFKAAYYSELYRTPNIHVEGWVDVASPRFLEIASRCAGLINPSCAEGGGGSVITCMHAGLIPLASRESSVDIEETYGVVLNDCAVDTIRQQALAFSQRSPDLLRDMARNAWTFARTHHTRERFAHAYRRFVETQLEGR